MRDLPKFYDNLDLTLEEIKYLLTRGIKDRKSCFHYTVLSTINNEFPESRTVILRNFNEENFELNIHSDLRSKKINQIIKNKNISCLFYDDKKKIQIRINGQAEIEKSYKPSWEKLTNWSKRCYLSTAQPGTEVTEPSSGFPDKFINDSPNNEDSIKGLKNFSVIRIVIRRIEWLYLASQGHRRANYEIVRKNSSIKVIKKWLVP
ncbi:MAG: pyridoxamine 5'-phosphate oxidase family protein [Alphaproteobacteria bacterium]|tara:strand:+ start:1090 stop:1704 length:615 start_codon:yes stop_codon:yes gene_type:complete